SWRMVRRSFAGLAAGSRFGCKAIADVAHRAPSASGYSTADVPVNIPRGERTPPKAFDAAQSTIARPREPLSCRPRWRRRRDRRRRANAAPGLSCVPSFAERTAMKPCTTCGNDIADDAWRCHWCGSQQTGAAPRPRRKRPRIVTVDLEADRPTVAQAMRRMESELMAARTLGARVVRLIHGYGSSGTGGRIRTAALSLLRRMQRRGL